MKNEIQSKIGNSTRLKIGNMIFTNNEAVQLRTNLRQLNYKNVGLHIKASTQAHEEIITVNKIQTKDFSKAKNCELDVHCIGTTIKDTYIQNKNINKQIVEQVAGHTRKKFVPNMNNKLINRSKKCSISSEFKNVVQSSNTCTKNEDLGSQSVGYFIDVGLFSHTTLQISKDMPCKILKCVGGKTTFKVAKNPIIYTLRKNKVLQEQQNRITKQTQQVNTIRNITKKVAIVPKKTMQLTGKAVSHCDDETLQNVDNVIKTSNNIIHTVKTVLHISTIASNASIQLNKGLIKTGTTSYSQLKNIKNYGLKQTWNKAKKVTQFSKVFGKIIFKAARTFIAQFIIPIVIICIIVTAAYGITVSPFLVFGSIFGSMFEIQNENEYEIREYILNSNYGIPILVSEFAQDLSKKIQNDSKNYDIVRLNSSFISKNIINCTPESICSLLPNNEQLATIIQPIFNAIILMDYELEPTESEAKHTLVDIFSKLLNITTTQTTEYCGQDLETGIGDPTEHNCSHIHALENCPNKEIGFHENYTCDECCYVFNGYNICSGYEYCGGHNILTYTINIDGTYALMDEYFIKPINKLSNITNRSQEEEEKLQNLKDYYEICLEYMNEVCNEFGSGISVADIINVKFVNGNRIGCQPLIDYAISEVGNVGGKTYWQYYGFTNHVEWCACFVHWCMNTSGYGSSYPTTANNAYCETVANGFKNDDRWVNKDYDDIVAGDTIFFDWQVDGHIDHVGLVIGRDNKKVYTVEGNSGDAVRINSYLLNSFVIAGYGLMNF